ncbi:calcium-binding protein [Sphingobium sp. CECT 9361]|uniref:calcium-binding protein n=1 Tax=Sphingobium sp. CECT 9361 TaxID=2845384 RepID=UPI001EF9C77B|nr:calcium-binding protein [Sphingobium sp. CECT 9361]CAH0356452.1 hypothetical protein SPH9361_04096 [Sphingobium sp. CECT 9361]
MVGTVITLNAGVTEADIQAALNSLPSGGTLVLPKNATILISKGLSLNVENRSITLDLNGSTLQQAADTSVITVDGRMAASGAAQLGHDGSGALTVSYSGAAKVSVGDYVKIYSDDVLSNDQGAATRLGQAMKVVGVNGSTLVLEGDLLYEDQYKTNVRASEFQSGTAVVTNGTVRGDQSHPSWNDALVSARSTIGTQFDHLTVRDGNSMGINFVNSVNGLVTQSSAINLTDDTANGHYGYGVHSASSVGTTVNGFYAQAVRHGVDDNAVGLSATHVDPSKYGADIGLTATNVVANGTTSFAFSWHSEGRFSTYSDSVVFNSFGVLGGRGTDNSFQDISGSGNNKGILFFEYGDGDGRRITVDNVNLKENSGYAYFNQNAPTENTLSNSVFEILTNKVTIKPDSTGVTMTNNSLKVGAFATDETITGGDAADRLLGGLGVDTIRGGNGNDYIWGGAGADLLTGGAGQDRFAFHALSEAGDILTDFKAGTSGDVIDLSVMARQLGWSGDLLAKGYVRFTKSGTDTLLQVDSDGGANSLTTLATLKNVSPTALTSHNLSTDIVVTDYSQLPDSTSDGPSVGTDPSGGAVSIPAPVPAAPAPVTTEVTAKIEMGGTAFSSLTGFNKVYGTTGVDTLVGTVKADLIIGGAGADKLIGGDGDDILSGGSGADFLQGGGGKDTASYADAASGVVANIASASLNMGDAAGDKYSQIENLTGSSFADTLTGNNSMNILIGGAGDDRLFGMDGVDSLTGGVGNDWLDGGLKNDILDGGLNNDRLIGGDGFDTLTGGAGADIFVLDPSFKRSFDTVTDFAAGTDKIGLAHLGLAKMSSVAFEVTSKLVASSAAPTLLYSDQTGALLWDADGSGSGAAVQIAQFQNNPTLHLSDFFIV